MAEQKRQIMLRFEPYKYDEIAQEAKERGLNPTNFCMLLVHERLKELHQKQAA